MDSKEIIFFILILTVPALGVQDTVIQVNTIKWSQVVSERFLSLSIDPLAIILAGKLGPATLNMAKGLSPLFVRIGGPNTENVRFGSSPSSRNNISVTEDEWVAVNRFAQEARMDLVLCLRAMRRTQTVWDSANALEIISASHKHGFTDIWQMGWDMSEMTGIGGAELGRDIVRLKKILDAFPGYENAPILAPGLSCCLNNFQIRFIKDLLQESSTAVSALPVHLNFSGASLEKVPEMIGSILVQMEEQIWSKDLLLRSTIPRKPIWMSELEPNSGDFHDAMKWMVKLGSAAKFGIQVVMRQPHLWSFHAPTHDYWASLLYKNLVGRFVFDTRVMTGNKSSTFLYSHCTHPTNDETTILSSKWNYEKGAMTLFGINPSGESAKILAKGISMKDEMVHLYVLTEETSDSSKDKKLHPPHTLFNGQKLILSPKGELPLLSPKERRVSRNQAISVPPHSIFFMVFPDVKVRMCMTNPFTTDEFQDLTKRLAVPRSNGEDIIDSWEDNNAERVYVSFSKRIPMSHKLHQDDMKSKLLKDWHKVAGKLGIEKDRGEDLDKIKYNFYNDQSWLSKLAEGIRKDSSEDIAEEKPDSKSSDSDSEQARLEKYALLTSAIYGKDGNGSNLYKVSASTNEAPDPYSHLRFVRNVDSQINKSNEENQNLSGQVHSTGDSNEDNSNKETMDKQAMKSDSYKNIQEYVLDYMDKNGHNIDNSNSDLPLDKLMKNLEHVDVSYGQPHVSKKSFFDENDSLRSTYASHELLGESSDDSLISTNHLIRKRSPTILEIARNKKEMGEDGVTGKEANPEKTVESDFEDVSTYLKNKDKITSLAGVKENDLKQIIGENVESGGAFEVAPEPEDEVGSVKSNDDIPSSTDGLNDLMSNESPDKPVTEGLDATNDGSSSEASSNSPVTDDANESVSSAEDDGKLDLLNLDKSNQESETLMKREELPTYPQYSLDGIKTLPKLGRISEILEQLKAKGLQHPGIHRSAKLEERIQKLEGIKSRVIEIKEKIKSEINKAKEKLASNLDNIKNPSDQSDSHSYKRDIYEVPDKLAGIFEKLNFKYMNTIPSKSRFRRSPILSDDEIDEILERELAETVNEFYNEQMLNMEDEDYSDQVDASNFHYLVPAVPGTHNVLMDREVFPAKIYNMVKGDKLHSILNDEQESISKQMDFSDALEKFQNRNKLNLHMLNEEDEHYNSRHNLQDMLGNFQYRKNLGLYNRYNRNNYGLNSFRPYLPENEYDPRDSFIPLDRNYHKSVLRNKRKFSPSYRSRPYYYGDEDDEDFPLVVYPRNGFGMERIRRSPDLKGSNTEVQEKIREKRSLDNNEVETNFIKKDLPLKHIKEDPLKNKVDKMFENTEVSLHRLAKEYTKLSEGEIDSSNISPKNTDVISHSEGVITNLNAPQPNKPVFETINKIITNGESMLSSGMNLISDIKINDLIENSKDSLNNIISEDTSPNQDYSEEEYSVDWIANAERVSPPLDDSKTKVTKPPKKASEGHLTSAIGKLLKKIKHIVHLISGFKISDYIKGKKKSVPEST